MIWLCGEGLLKINMVCKASGPLRRSWAPLDAVLGRPSGGCCISFTTTFLSKWVME